MTETVEQVTHLEVRVAGWRYPRHAILRDDHAEMEIARTHCSHCSTCRGRIAHCESALSGQVFERRSAGGGEYFVFPYPVELARDPKTVTDFLSRKLYLQIVPA